MRRFILPLALIIAFASCGPGTQITDSWRDPNVTIDTNNIHKFIVAALMRNSATRHQIEDDMAARFPGKAVQSYQVFGDKELNDEDDVYNKRLSRDGYDGIIMMRLVDVNNTTRYVPGAPPPYYLGWRSYWRYSWTGFYDPGYYTTDKTYDVEVTVYSLKRNKLIWTANTSTVNPNGRKQLFNDVGKVVLDKMRKEGFLQ